MICAFPIRLRRAWKWFLCFVLQLFTFYLTDWTIAWNESKSENTQRHDGNNSDWIAQSIRWLLRKPIVGKFLSWNWNLFYLANIFWFLIRSIFSPICQVYFFFVRQIHLFQLLLHQHFPNITTMSLTPWWCMWEFVLLLQSTKEMNEFLSPRLLILLLWTFSRI